jgi:hypothetical protein
MAMTGIRRRLRSMACVTLSATLLTCLEGCATEGAMARVECSEDQVAQWQIPAGWIERELTPAEARVEVSTANVAKDAAESRWEFLQNQRRDGDRYWRYRRPETDTINALGVQEGIVLIRGCAQVGFVTTRIAAESTSGG